MEKVFKTLDKAKPFYDMMYKVVMFICKIFLILDILITCYAVLGRYIPFIEDPAWSEQVVLSLMAYMAVLSAALAIRKDTHIRMNAFDRYLPPIVLKILDILSDIAVFALAIIMMVVGMKYAYRMRNGFYESMTWLSRFWMYFPVPVAGFAMIIFEFEKLYLHIKSFFVKEEKKTDEQLAQEMIDANKVE